MLVGYKTGSEEPEQEKLGLASVDLETQQAASRYVGHGGHVSCIATSEGDPSTFMTAATDGVVRLYDARAPAPVLDVFHNDEFIDTALYEHIGGHSFLIIGGSTSQQVKVWDIRAQLPLYELSTGNNQVNALAWDTSSQTLYAATDCEYFDRSRHHHEYRRAKLPKSTTGDADEDSYDDSEGPNWPKKAYHNESGFGHLLDSAEHRVYVYHFKEDADPAVVPISGYSTRGEWIRGATLGFMRRRSCTFLLTPVLCVRDSSVYCKLLINPLMNASIYGI